MSISLVPAEAVRKHPANTSPSKIINQFSKSKRFLDPNPEYKLIDSDVLWPSIPTIAISPRGKHRSDMGKNQTLPELSQSHPLPRNTKSNHSSRNISKKVKGSHLDSTERNYLITHTWSLKFTKTQVRERYFLNNFSTKMKKTKAWILVLHADLGLWMSLKNIKVLEKLQAQEHTRKSTACQRMVDSLFQTTLMSNSQLWTLKAQDSQKSKIPLALHFIKKAIIWQGTQNTSFLRGKAMELAHFPRQPDLAMDFGNQPIIQVQANTRKFLISDSMEMPNITKHSPQWNDFELC